MTATSFGYHVRVPSRDPQSLTWIMNKLGISAAVERMERRLKQYDQRSDDLVARAERQIDAYVTPPLSPCQICDRRFLPEPVVSLAGYPVGNTVVCATCREERNSRAANGNKRDSLPLVRIEMAPWRRLAARAAYRWRRIAGFFWTFPG